MEHQQQQQNDTSKMCKVFFKATDLAFITYVLAKRGIMPASPSSWAVDSVLVSTDILTNIDPEIHQLPNTPTLSWRAQNDLVAARASVLVGELLRFYVQLFVAPTTPPTPPTSSPTNTPNNNDQSPPSARAFVWPQALLACTSVDEVTAWLASQGVDGLDPVLLSEGGLASRQHIKSILQARIAKSLKRGREQQQQQQQQQLWQYEQGSASPRKKIATSPGFGQAQFGVDHVYTRGGGSPPAGLGGGRTTIDMRERALKIKAAREARGGGGGFGGSSSPSRPLHFGGSNNSPFPVSDFTFNFKSPLPGAFPAANNNGNNSSGFRPFVEPTPVIDLTSSAGGGAFAGANNNSPGFTFGISSPTGASMAPGVNNSSGFTFGNASPGASSGAAVSPGANNGNNNNAATPINTNNASSPGFSFGKFFKSHLTGSGSGSGAKQPETQTPPATPTSSPAGGLGGGNNSSNNSSNADSVPGTGFGTSKSYNFLDDFAG